MRMLTRLTDLVHAESCRKLRELAQEPAPQQDRSDGGAGEQPSDGQHLLLNTCELIEHGGSGLAEEVAGADDQN